MWKSSLKKSPRIKFLVPERSYTGHGLSGRHRRFVVFIKIMRWIIFWGRTFRRFVRWPRSRSALGYQTGYRSSTCAHTGGAGRTRRTPAAQVSRLRISCRRRLVSRSGFFFSSDSLCRSSFDGVLFLIVNKISVCDSMQIVFLESAERISLGEGFY